MSDCIDSAVATQQPAAEGNAGRKIGLALSGGGVRAAVFHLGVIKRLAEEGLLEEVSTVSTVSGGSLVMAAVISRSGMSWPSSRRYLQSIFPELRRLMTAADLFSFKAIGWSGVVEFNARLFMDRAAVLSTLLERQWGILPAARRSSGQSTLADQCHLLGDRKELALRQARNGRHWTFGRNYAPDVPLSMAAAASVWGPVRNRRADAAVTTRRLVGNRSGDRQADRNAAAAGDFGAPLGRWCLRQHGP